MRPAAVFLLGLGVLGVAMLGYAGAFEEKKPQGPRRAEPEPAGVREKLRASYPDATSIAFSGKNWAVSFKRAGKPFKPTLYFDASGNLVADDD